MTEPTPQQIETLTALIQKLRTTPPVGVYYKGLVLARQAQIVMRMAIQRTLKGQVEQDQPDLNEEQRKAIEGLLVSTVDTDSDNIDLSQLISGVGTFVTKILEHEYALLEERDLSRPLNFCGQVWGRTLPYVLIGLPWDLLTILRGVALEARKDTGV